MFAVVTITEKTSSYVNYPAFAVLFLLLLAGPTIGYLIGRTRGRGGLGIFLGFFGILGWILIAVLPRSTEAEARRQVAVAQKMDEPQRQAA